MRKLSRSGYNKILAILSATVGVALYQACGDARFLNLNEATTITKSEGNGDSYSGKLGYYNSSEITNPCQRLSSRGQPFPKQQIFFMNGVYSMVRDNCRDITPVALDSTQITINPVTQSLTYQGNSFAYKQDLSEFNQVPVTCPVGKTLDTVSGNLFTSPLDLTANAWRVHPEIPAALAGSIEALPSFRVEVTTPDKLENWRRVSQNPAIYPNTSYVVSFLLKAGTQNFATIFYNELPAGQFVVSVDLVNAQASIHWQEGVTMPVITSVQRYGEGVAVSVAFTSASTATGMMGDLGVAPFRPNNNDYYVMGDSIYATAAGLHYCR